MGLRENCCCSYSTTNDRITCPSLWLILKKYNPFERPVMTLSVTGKRPSASVREITRRIIKDGLEKVEGVASATISGGIEREIVVEIDHSKLHSTNIPIMDVVDAIAQIPTMQYTQQEPLYYFDSIPYDPLVYMYNVYEIPEPTTLSLLALGAFFAGRRKYYS